MAEADRTPAEWIEELTAAYAGLGGYIVTYRSEGDAKHLDATLAMDRASGLGAVDMEAIRNGIRIVAKQWNNADDDFFVHTGDGHLTRIPAFRSLMNKALDDLAAALPFPDVKRPQQAIHFSPELFLSATELHLALGFSSTDKPSWRDDAEDGTLKAINAETVTFETKDRGLLTIGRKHGLLTRQAVTAEDGEVRVLELRTLTLNPGRDAVAEISARWSTENAVTVRGVDEQFTHRALYVGLLQSLIDTVEEGETDLATLEKALADGRGKLRAIAGAGLTGPGNLFDDETIDALLDSADAAIRDFWLQADPQAKEGDAAAFAAFRAKEEVRTSIRDQIVVALIKLDGAKEGLLTPTLGAAGGDALVAGTAVGKAAKAAIETALATAYCEAFLDAAMATRWGPATAK